MQSKGPLGWEATLTFTFFFFFFFFFFGGGVVGFRLPMHCFPGRGKSTFVVAPGFLHEAEVDPEGFFQKLMSQSGI